MADVILIEVINLYNWEPLQKTSRAQMVFQKVGKRKTDEILKGFALFILNFYKAMILNAIRTQKFPTRYQPLSPEYVARKRRKGWRPGFWEMTGFLQQNLSIWQDASRSFCIGFREGIVHPVSGTPILTIVKALEQGVPAHNLPARPLFFPLARAISKHIYDVHFKRFMQSRHPELYRDMMYEEKHPGETAPKSPKPGDKPIPEKPEPGKKPAPKKPLFGEL